MENIEELKKKCDELINKCEELGKEIERLEKEKKNKRWRAEKDGTFYYIMGNLEIGINSPYAQHEEFLYNIGNYFKTEEEAQKVANKIKTYIELKQLAEELNGDEEIDWKNENQEKYRINLENKYKQLILGGNWTEKCATTIYCLDENFLNKALEQIGEERLKELFE